MKLVHVVLESETGKSGLRYFNHAPPVFVPRKDNCLPANVRVRSKRHAREYQAGEIARVDEVRMSVHSPQLSIVKYPRRWRSAGKDQSRRKDDRLCS